MSKVKRLNKVQESLEDVKKLPILAIDGSNMTHNRMITKQTAEHFGIRTLFDESQQKVTGYYFPVTKKGEVTGFIKVNLNVSKKSEGRFSVVGDVSIDCDLVGQSVAPKDSKRKLWIVEGVWDMAIAWQCLKEGGEDFLRKQGKQQELCPAVVTFPLGIGDPTKQEVTNARRALGQNIEFIEEYQELYTCFDNDTATDENVGQLGVQDCALVLKDFKNILLKHNDISDTYKYEGAGYTYKQLMFEGKTFESEHVVQGGVGMDELLQPLKKGVYVDVIPHTMNMLHGLREREMTIVLAPTGVGKTTVCKEIGYALVKGGKRVGHIFLEEDLKKTQQSYIALDNNVHLPKLRSNPSVIPKEQFERSYNELINTERVMWMSHFGSMSPASLMNKFEWMAIKGMQYIVLDHISMVFSGQNSKNERQEIDQLLTELAAFTTKTGVHPIIVSHIKRVNKQAPKDKNGNVKYPYWDVVDETQARGSGAFEQLAWNIIALEPEKLEDGTRGRIRTRVLKNREWGTLGAADTLTMDPITGRLKTVLETEEEY